MRLRCLATLIVVAIAGCWQDETAKRVPKPNPADSAVPSRLNGTSKVHQTLSPPDALDPAKIAPQDRVAKLPREVVAILGSNRGRHSEPAKCVAVSPDGRWVASGSRDGSVRLWDPLTLQERQVMKHPDDVDVVAFAQDSKRLYSVCWDGNLRMWNLSAEVPEPMTIARLNSERTTCVISQDCNIVVASSVENEEPIVRILRIDGAVARPIHRDLDGFKELHDPSHLALSNDGRWVAAGSSVLPDGAVYLWDLQRPAADPRWILSDEGVRIESLTFAPDTSTLLVGGDRGEITIWTFVEPQPNDDKEQAKNSGPAPKKRDSISAHRDGVGAMVFTPDGKRLITGGNDHRIGIWKWHNSSLVRCGELRGHSDWIGGVACSPDGSVVYSAGWDHSVRRWAAAGDSYTPADDFAGHQHPVAGIAFSPDGSLIATGALADITVRNLPANEVRLWRMGGSQAQADKVLNGCTGRIQSVAFSHDGQLVAAACESGVLCWDVATATLVSTLKHTTDNYGEPYDSPAESVAFAPDRRELASGWSQPHLRLSAFTNLPPTTVSTWEPPNHHIAALAFSPDGRTLAAASTNLYSVFLLEPTNLRLRFQLTPPKTESGLDRLEAVDFSSDGDHLAAAGRNGGVFLWDARAGADAVAQVLRGHETVVSSVSFGGGGTVLASGDWDGRVVLWDVATQKSKIVWEFPGRIWRLKFAPDGRVLAVGDGTGAVYVVRLKDD